MSHECYQQSNENQKKCSICKEYVCIELFSVTKKGKQESRCMECNRKRSRERYQRNLERDREKNRQKSRDFRQNHPDKVKQYRKNLVKSNKERSKEYYAKNKTQINANKNERDKERLKTDILFRTKHYLRVRLNKELRRVNTTKSDRTVSLLGCSIEELRAHLESNFTIGMSWENYGIWQMDKPMTWHIDHIRPCASFDLSDPEQQRECFHWTNLQPLWAIDNLTKGDRT